jgi:hypothetical protein
MRPRDDIDAERSRTAVVSLVAWSGDASLRATAVALAKNWRSLPSSNRGAVLEIAADTDAATFDRLLAAIPAETNPEMRLDLLRAVSQVTREAQLRSALALALDPRIELSEVFPLVFAGRDPAQFRVVDLYFRDHLDELLARFPDKGNVSRLASTFLRGCDPGQRDDAIAFVREHLSKLPGAERNIARSLESFDQCVAARNLLAPRLAAWLARPPR